MSPAGGASILQSLKTFGVDPEEVIDMISNRAGPWSPFFLGRFNVDTLDAITRSATYLQRNSYHSPPYAVMLAEYSDGLTALSDLDSFWRQKDFVYKNLIFGPEGVRADLNAQVYMVKNIDGFRREHFLLSETELKRLQPRLFAAIDKPRWDCVTINRRRFQVDESVRIQIKDILNERNPFPWISLFGPKNLNLFDPAD